MPKYRFLSAAAALALVLAPVAAAQTATQDAQPAAPAAGPSSPFHQAGMDFSFLLDGYVEANFNHPDSGWNGLRTFDFRADTLHLNMAKATIDLAPQPVGFHLDVGFGQFFSATHALDRAPQAFKYFEQAYVDFKPQSWKGVEVDFGEFGTSAGAEVYDVNGNWNYTRSLLFSWAIPFYHFGVRTSFPVGPHFTGGVQVVQGWNDVYDNNSGKTLGLNAAYAWKKVTWTNVWYGGPEKTRTNAGWRNLYDTTVLVNATDNLSYYVNFDYGRDKNVGPGTAHWAGIAFAARRALGKKLALAGRAEYFSDKDGFATGTAQSLEEVTVTGEYKLADWLTSRLEFRNDWSDQPFFEKSGGSFGGTQPTVLLGIYAFFGPKK